MLKTGYLKNIVANFIAGRMVASPGVTQATWPISTTSGTTQKFQLKGNHGYENKRKLPGKVA